MSGSKTLLLFAVDAFGLLALHFQKTLAVARALDADGGLTTLGGAPPERRELFRVSTGHQRHAARHLDRELVYLCGIGPKLLPGEIAPGDGGATCREQPRTQ